MEQFRLETDNALELYLRDPTVERAREIVRSTNTWPLMERGRHVGLLTGIIDALQAKHGDDFLRMGPLARVGYWMTRKSCPTWRPGWNDYWMVYWILTQDRSGYARNAAREIHRRAFHIHPEPGRFRLANETAPLEWAMTEAAALWMVRSQVDTLPAFRAAFDYEILGCPDEARHRLQLKLPRAVAS